MSNLHIVEYEPKYAAAVADMWNHSVDGWGGGNTIQTAERVQQSEANSVNLHTYLAVEGDKVLGYCGVSEYREDTGALYIALLNVRDDHHGKKIGKQLVLKAIERTIELGWPRIDLYTWASNTKAVPLYKKCGFFWEDRDDTVHLMNFIPTVLHTEAVQYFFAHADWYADSIRSIDVQPDGDKEGEFDFYTYAWEKDGKQLRMQFERKGRGLRTIETDDYRIVARMEKQNVVFGEHYPIHFHIENKSGQPLHVAFSGHNDDNIHFDWKHEQNVTESEIVTAHFFVAPIEEEQSVWRTHPTVTTRLLINGKEAVFKLGVSTKYPAKMRAVVPYDASFLGVSEQFYIEVENNYDSDVTIRWQLPPASFIEIEREHIEFSLAAKQRTSIPITYRLRAYGYYAPTLSVTVTKPDGTSQTFRKAIGLAFHGIGARIYGENEHYWEMANGLGYVWLDKFDNRIAIGRSRSPNHADQTVFFYYPKIGKPFSSELSKKRPERVQFFEEGNAICLRATYRSNDFHGLMLHTTVKLYAEGLVEHYHEIENTSAVATAEPLWINKSVRHDLLFSVIPYEGRILELDGHVIGQYAVWESDKLSENWLFSNDPTLPYGLTWSNDDAISFEMWFPYFEQHVGIIPAQSAVKAPSTHISIGAFPTWQQFRQFALQRKAVTPVTSTDYLELCTADRNPFVADIASIRAHDARHLYMDGEIVLYKDTDKQIETRIVHLEEQASAVHFDVTMTAPLHVVKSVATLTNGSWERQALLLRKNGEAVRTEIVHEHGAPVYAATNGRVQIKVAPDYGPALVSLQYDGYEWLDTPYPEHTMRSWWNPWLGGVRDSFHKITTMSLLKEERQAQFVTHTDDRGNMWHGIRMTVNIRQQEHYRGLTYHQYFLLQKGVPIVCHTTEVVQHTQQYLHYDKLVTIAAFKPKHEAIPTTVTFAGTDGRANRMQAGLEENEYRLDRSITVHYPERTEKLQIISDVRTFNSELFTNKDVLHLHTYHNIHLAHGERMMTTPTFYLFTDEVIPEEALVDLKNIRFQPHAEGDV